MVIEVYQKSNVVQGVFLMVTGVVLLLHTLGIWQTIFTSALILISIILIAYGFYRAEFVTQTLILFKKNPFKK